MSNHEQTHTPEGDEAVAAVMDPKPNSTAYVGFVGILVVIITIVALEAVFYQAERGERQTKLYEQVHSTRAALQMEQRAMLASYGRDAETGAIRIPIDRAMELVLKEMKRPDR